MNKENIDSELNTSLNEIDAVNSSYHIAVKPEFNKVMIEFYNSGSYNVLPSYLLPYYERSLHIS
ncbi:MAG: hypothetical protein M0Z57_03095 [Deltaproteobacteria bacterium]|jgi:hypothetical protein|uniref:Uncharacterized protein n=1 Tax=Candidatus Acidulodesulfobacterium acidiphilum TaxID=2597224 RepID=A0A520X6B3_9DELT|nr:hypothetical protein [Deltaproteobacteria bacterium]MDA8298978.1 hypothetical protein [Deltaproteobacteria bacterium]RZV36635.1 MAG: hypothetical protein EVJ48_10185 [Candidatus Acidulodesulfobacterium acidiphilum]